jgi:hypothetical protein
MAKMRCVFCVLTAATLFFLSASIARAGELQLTIADGKVTLVADNVPVRTILTEWARIGQTKIVNAEKLTGGPVTLRLVDVPEAQALDIVLRSASGYLAAPRAAGNLGPSQFDRVVILASSRPIGGPAPAPNNSFQNMNPRFQPPPPMVQPVESDDQEEEEIMDEEGTPNRVFAPGVQTHPGMPVQVAPGMTAPNVPNAPGSGMVPSVIPGLTPNTAQPGTMPQQQPPPGMVVGPITSPRPGPVPIPTPQPQTPNPNKPIPR